MSKVLITRSKLDGLASTIAAKSGATLPLTLDQMDAAVRSISGGGVTVEPLSVTANGTYTAPSGTAYSPVTVAVPSGGGVDSGDRSDPIRFFDYDGTLVASYKSAPSALPDVPTHAKLTNGTWNHTLAQVASQFASIGTCDVGANYDTASGNTEIDVTLDSDHLEPWLCIAVNGTATVDWGDGGATDTITGTSFTTLKFAQHTYAQAGDYTIMVDGTVGFYNESNIPPAVLRTTNDSSTSRRRSQAYSKCVTAVRVANGSHIGNYAFYNCYSLASVSIPDGVTSVGDSAFSNCYSLASVSIPDGMTSIGKSAFSSCHSLTSITIPDSVTSISNNMFNSCYSLASVSIPESVTSIGITAFQNCYSLASVSIPEGATSIGTYTFSSCYSLTSVSIPDSVTNIGQYAFSNCYSMTSVTIPNGVTKIDSYAFYNCYSLASVSIPESVTSIGDNAFSSCYCVIEYHLLPTTPPTLVGTNAFRGIVAGTVIYVPAGSLKAYQTATNWSTYSRYMQEES